LSYIVDICRDGRKQTLFSLMPDKGAVMRIGASFAQKVQENIQRRVKCVKQVNTLLIPTNRNAIG
jgi:hypothetical protein